MMMSSLGVAQKATLLLWPGGNPEPSKVVGAETVTTTVTPSGRSVLRVTNVSQPSLTGVCACGGEEYGGGSVGVSGWVVSAAELYDGGHGYL